MEGGRGGEGGRVEEGEWKRKDDTGSESDMERVTEEREG